MLRMKSSVLFGKRIIVLRAPLKLLLDFYGSPTPVFGESPPLK